LEKDFIKDGFSSHVDELRKIAYHSDKLIIDYQQELVEQLQVAVRIKYVNNQGYLLEVSKKDVEKFEKAIKNLEGDKFSFTRKQTLKIAERYISPYLKELEEKSLNAVYQLQEEEKQILEQWKHTLH
jgi:DNA mismatch repair protein MutS